MPLAREGSGSIDFIPASQYFALFCVLGLECGLKAEKFSKIKMITGQPYLLHTAAGINAGEAAKITF